MRATPPPSGELTYLFTDLEGSTSLWERFPEAMAKGLERHDALIRRAIEEHDGFVFNIIGDAFHGAFVDAADGLSAALDAQGALLAEDWAKFGPGFPAIKVRMGLHTGRGTYRDGDYYGRALNRVARLESAGNGGQVLLSRTALALLDGRLPEGVRLRDLGEHRLKDLHHSEHITQVVADYLPDDTRALRTAGALDPRDRIVVRSEPVASDRQEPDAGDLPAATTLTRDVSDTLSALSSAVCGDAPEEAFTPEQLVEAARHHPADLREYRLGRIAEWSLPRHRLDGRFVGLTLMLDQGEDVLGGRWQASGDTCHDLRDLLDSTEHPAMVLLGSPGAGKSTLLRRLELETAIDSLRGDDATQRVSFFAPLNRYAGARPGEPAPLPADWLSARWAEQYPDLSRLDDLLDTGRVLLLLDGLNEMPVTDEAEYRTHVGLWRSLTQSVVARGIGNRVVFSCRSLDYSAPLSTPELRVPQVRIEPLSDEEVRRFLALNAPRRWRELWAELQGSAQLEALRTPYFLKLLADYADTDGGAAPGPAALFSGFVREALRREVERDNPLFRPDGLLASRDHRRLLTTRNWKTPYDLPERGVLVPKLARLAHRMQSGRESGEGSQVSIDYDDALDALDDPRDEDILAAGMSLAVLDEDAGRDEILFFHQLMQEYFAARVIASQPDPELVGIEWRADSASPSLADAIAELEPADPLPPLPSTGWEETTVLAAAMAADPDEFVRGLERSNPEVAARCVAQPEIVRRLDPGVAQKITDTLLGLIEDMETDLRYRIALAMRLGEIGDPRLERFEGPHGPYLQPPMVEFREAHGAPRRLGDGSASAPDGSRVGGSAQLPPYALGRFAVTNAEWRLFMQSGGYDDDSWWRGRRAREWQVGQGTTEGQRHDWRSWRRQFQEDPERLEALVAGGQMPLEWVELWRERVRQSDDEFEAMLRERYPSRRETEPRLWDDTLYAHPAQPVVGVCLYEARAYCAWLSAQTGASYRLPTEAEWEAAASGREGRTYAYGDVFDPTKCNVGETHLRHPSPIGAFPNGRTPEGLDDMTGNTFDWTDGDPVRTVELETATAGESSSRHDGLAGASRLAVARGGSFPDGPEHAAASFRFEVHPALRHTTVGLRLALDLTEGTDADLGLERKAQ